MRLVRSLITWKSFALVLVVLALWLAGLIAYSTQVPSSVSDQTTRTDAIVALTGGSGRVSTGIDLLAADMADQLFISGTGRDVNAEDLISRERPDRDTLLTRMSVGAEAESTWGNATETAEWAKQNGIRSMRVVTAAYHMPRSLKELRHAMPNMRIIAHPVFPEQVKKDWWRNPGSAGLLAREYTKYLLASLRLWSTDTLSFSNSEGAKPQ